jgi:S-DNA-T family DNA segregation ATPase FtsK/SpoIIIE
LFNALRKNNISFPQIDLLDPPDKNQSLPPDKNLLEQKGVRLMACLSDFGIQGTLAGITPGPVVSMFEIRPAPGIKVSRIIGLNDDLALALKALAVRIQAPIPGSDTVGVEIPNDTRAMVSLRELLQDDSFIKSDASLSMALGKDIGGKPMIADLARMPHLLVAGATGAGKSVCLNSVLLSFLFKYDPDQVKLLLIDPKRIELAAYADLPHLVHPVVTDPAMAKLALDWAVYEMEERIKKLSRLGARNIAGYNQKLAEFGNAVPAEFADLEPLPLLVIVIDELSDLMITAGKDVETSIVRLAQLARAAGMHLVVATQRPSVDVVTGLIKANFPCRISFQVTSKHDSRTILDTIGAEHLLGKGDMLFKPSGGRLQRLHGAFVSDDEVARVTDFWRQQQSSGYTIDFEEWRAQAEPDKLSAPGANGADENSIYHEIVDFVREQQGKVSISLLQRRFRIGFNKAARFVEQMEKDGIMPPGERQNRR